jgi:transposase-like protein
MNKEIRRRTKTISSFPDEESAVKLFYFKSVEFNSKHAFRKMNGTINATMRLNNVQ